MINGSPCQISVSIKQKLKNHFDICYKPNPCLNFTLWKCNAQSTKSLTKSPKKVPNWNDKWISNQPKICWKYIQNQHFISEITYVSKVSIKKIQKVIWKHFMDYKNVTANMYICNFHSQLHLTLCHDRYIYTKVSTSDTFYERTQMTDTSRLNILPNKHPEKNIPQPTDTHPNKLILMICSKSFPPVSHWERLQPTSGIATTWEASAVCNQDNVI